MNKNEIIDKIINDVDCEEGEVYIDFRTYHLNNDNLRTLLEKHLPDYETKIKELKQSWLLRLNESEDKNTSNEYFIAHLAIKEFLRDLQNLLTHKSTVGNH